MQKCDTKQDQFLKEKDFIFGSISGKTECIINIFNGKVRRKKTKKQQLWNAFKHIVNTTVFCHSFQYQFMVLKPAVRKILGPGPRSFHQDRATTHQTRPHIHQKTVDKFSDFWKNSVIVPKFSELTFGSGSHNLQTIGLNSSHIQIFMFNY